MPVEKGAVVLETSSVVTGMTWRLLTCVGPAI